MNLNNVSDESDDSEEFEEFLFDSIQRYNTLQMFNLENVPYQLLQLDDTSLCVGSKRIKGENSELLKLQLPDKLTLPPEEEGRCRGNDFKVLSGLYTGSLVYKIDKLSQDDKIIASEFANEGLKIYDLSASSSGGKNEGTEIKAIPWRKSEILVLDEGTIVCSKCISDPLIVVDVAAAKKVTEINQPFQNVVQNNQMSGNSLQINSFSPNVIIILNCLSGDLVLHDLRTNEFESLFREDEKQNEMWALGSQKFGNYFGVVSITKSFFIFDKRNNSVVHKKEETLPRGSFEHLRLKFSETKDRFSISGLGSLVDINQMNENDYEHVFSHKGHNPGNMPSILVTDHIWLKTGNKEFIVSICSNKTLNCWDYNV